MRIPRINQNWSYIVSCGALLALAGGWFALTSGWLMPVEASKESVQIDDLFRWMLGFAAVIFLGVQGVLIYAAFAVRRVKGDNGDGPHIHGDIKLEIFWTLIPTVLVLYLAIYSFDVFQQLGAGSPMWGGHDHGDAGLPRIVAPIDKSAVPPLKIEVQAMQFAWIFAYPSKKVEGMAELHLPVGQPVVLEMKSNDVIHAFWVPEFRLKQDVIPGRTTNLSFTPTRPGKYQLRCAELCGPYHGGMVVDVYVEDQKSFDKWLTSQAAVPSATRLAQLPDLATTAGYPVPAATTPVLRSDQTLAVVRHLRSQGQ